MSTRIIMTIHDAGVVRAEVNRTLTKPFGVVEIGDSASAATVFCNTAEHARAFARAFAGVAAELEAAEFAALSEALA